MNPYLTWARSIRYLEIYAAKGRMHAMSYLIDDCGITGVQSLDRAARRSQLLRLPTFDIFDEKKIMAVLSAKLKQLNAIK